MVGGVGGRDDGRLLEGKEEKKGLWVKDVKGSVYN